VSRRAEIIQTARRLLDERGPDELTMRSIADELGIRAPSLYKHIADKHELEVALIAQGFEEQALAFRVAVDDAGDPIAAIGATYRAWANAHPHLYRLMTDGPLPRDELPAGVEDAAAEPLVAAVGGDIDIARAVWSLAHGLVTLELADRFPPGADLDAAWSVGLGRLAAPSRPA